MPETPHVGCHRECGASIHKLDCPFCEMLDLIYDDSAGGILVPWVDVIMNEKDLM